jgi:putative SOS response-associated peptidase YedK
MCGRYVAVTPPEELASYFSASLSPELEAEFRPSWNVPPTTRVAAVTAGAEGDRLLAPYRWGLVPSWAKGLSFGANTVNARAESIATKASFRSAFRSRRCIIPADGYYEWRTTSGEVKQPYYFTRADGAPLAFAGLWEAWRPPVGPDELVGWVLTCAIVTTEAGADVQEIHTRMPVILEPGDLWDVWLDPELHDPHELGSLLRPATAGTLLRRRVAKAVGSVRNDSPALIDEVLESPSLF